jgi:hypothetical protein
MNMGRMSKKDFVALADALRDTVVRDSVVQPEFVPVVNALISFCRQQNSRFAMGRWLDYLRGLCGPSGGCKR